jgi:hypothetical protein
MTTTRLVQLLAAPTLALLVASPAPAASRPHGTAGARDTPPLGTHLVLSWNDLGMHCMNQYHADFSVLPPFNNLVAQVIRRGDALSSPEILTAGVGVEYSIPGNTTSVGKTDFWTYAPALFGVTLPPDIGLTGKGLTGTMDVTGTLFEARGIPVTPFTDATPTVESPYQQALVIARDAGGTELARSTPVIPVSVEINCVSSGCHSSINNILTHHESVTGFDASVRPILCAKCHASPALGTTGNHEAGYFSMRIHDAHSFMDQSMTGVAECYKCHPGPNTQCLRGAMSQRHGLTCQGCHGNMRNVSSTIENGRIPWVNEPACGSCHLARYAEPAGQLFRNSTGHGGVACEGCHGSTHADFPAREPADNANSIALQGHAGPIDACSVCHGITPTGPGPHGTNVAGVEASALLGASPLRAFPNPAQATCSFSLEARPGLAGRLTVFDSQGRIVRMLTHVPGEQRSAVAWDVRDFNGRRVAAGTYFARWQQGDRVAATRLTIVR